MIDIWIMFFGFFIGFIYGLYKKHNISTAFLYGVIGSILIPIIFFIFTVFFTLLTAFIILIVLIFAIKLVLYHFRYEDQKLTNFIDR